MVAMVNTMMDAFRHFFNTIPKKDSNTPLNQSAIVIMTITMLSNANSLTYAAANQVGKDTMVRKKILGIGKNQNKKVDTIFKKHIQYRVNIGLEYSICYLPPASFIVAQITSVFIIFVKVCMRNYIIIWPRVDMEYVT